MSERIHINVKRRSQQHGNDTYGYVVEASTDGAPFDIQYFCALQAGETMDDTRERAKDVARVFVNACRYAGRETVATCEGYAL